jgi:hypothetical protein
MITPRHLLGLCTLCRWRGVQRTDAEWQDPPTSTLRGGEHAGEKLSTDVVQAGSAAEPLLR